MDVLATLVVAGLAGWLLGLSMFKVNDKEIRRSDEPLRLTGWRPR
jgi:hypothetical protein